jgi:Putative beta-barrel porin-2, OmpL-like. bbp2
MASFPVAGMAQAAGASDAALRVEVIELRALVKQLEARVDVLERRGSAQASEAPPATPTPAVSAAAAMGAGANAPPAAAGVPGGVAGTTVNLGFDGYYGYNFNSPIGRANLLRAYDVSSNSFSINQANLVVDNAPDPANGKRFGARLDLQWGQATQTLQGNSTNEPRPDIYREIFQAYGTYVAPIGNGVTIDFGKWSSSIGLEGNYTKDQINYSRSFWFDYLPFYHMGLRMNYKVNDFLAVNYWVTNGTQQTEAFNGYKDQLAGFVLTPSKNLSWTVNYYLGQEHPDVTYYLNGNAPPGAPTQQGVPFEPIPGAPKGKLDIFDNYVAWQATPKLDFALEGDWVIERYRTSSPPQETMGGAAYVRRRLTPHVTVAGRVEYMNDRNGLYTGVPQSLKEATLTADYKMGEGFMLRWEWRRDQSNHPYFYSDKLG